MLATTFLFMTRARASWPVPRVLAAVGAFVAAIVATQSGVATHDTESFTAHVLQHVLLGMVVPVFAALAAPLTLVLQAADRRTRRVVRLGLRHPVVRMLSNPLVGFVAFGASLVVLVFSPLLDVAARNDAVHIGIHAHLVLVGCLFVWPIVGVDPIPHRPSHGARLLVVVASVPFHAFVGAALLTASSPLFDTYPSIDDQRRAAGLLWGAGELFTLGVAAIVFVDWYRADRRAGARADRVAVTSDDQSASRAKAAGT